MSARPVRPQTFFHPFNLCLPCNFIFLLHYALDAKYEFDHPQMRPTRSLATNINSFFKAVLSFSFFKWFRQWYSKSVWDHWYSKPKTVFLPFLKKYQALYWGRHDRTNSGNAVCEMCLDVFLSNAQNLSENIKNEEFINIRLNKKKKRKKTNQEQLVYKIKIYRDKWTTYIEETSFLVLSNYITWRRSVFEEHKGEHDSDLTGTIASDRAYAFTID